ncbi:cytochrome C oxidase subunit IV family protein [Gemmatimonas aurantiaca]|nr:cytochrome C oxidase subunit IV family protein [Gemmatimonas aurantiaca]
MSSHAKIATSHITPLKVYYSVAIALLVLTSVTVLVAQYDFGAWNLVVALSVAVFKAALVGLFFMHLLYDNKLYAIVFISSLIFLAVFISLTMFDTVNRGGVDSVTAVLINPYANIYDESGKVLDRTPKDPSSLSAFELENGIGPIKEKMTLLSLEVAIADQGRKIFEMKCASCHKLDERLVGPSLGDVTIRRTPEFIMNMILNPEEMTRNHPEVKKMLAEYLTFMTFQNVSKKDARKILEYLRAVGAEQSGQ